MAGQTSAASAAAAQPFDLQQVESQTEALSRELAELRVSIAKFSAAAQTRLKELLEMQTALIKNVHGLATGEPIDDDGETLAPVAGSSGDASGTTSSLAAAAAAAAAAAPALAASAQLPGMETAADVMRDVQRSNGPGEALAALAAPKDFSFVGPTDRTGQARKRRMRRKRKDPAAPRRALTGYMIYLSHQRKNRMWAPGLRPQDVVKTIAAEWKAMSHDEKQPYQDEADKDRERWAKEQEVYQQHKMLTEVAADSAKAAGGDMATSLLAITQEPPHEMLHHQQVEGTGAGQSGSAAGPDAAGAHVHVPDMLGGDMAVPGDHAMGADHHHHITAPAEATAAAAAASAAAAAAAAAAPPSGYGGSR